MSKWADFAAKHQQKISDERCARIRVVVVGTNTALTTIAKWEGVDATSRTIHRHLTGGCRCDHTVPALVRDGYNDPTARWLADTAVRGSV